MDFYTYYILFYSYFVKFFSANYITTIIISTLSSSLLLTLDHVQRPVRKVHLPFRLAHFQLLAAQSL